MAQDRASAGESRSTLLMVGNLMSSREQIEPYGTFNHPLIVVFISIQIHSNVHLYRQYLSNAKQNTCYYVYTIV